VIPQEFAVLNYDGRRFQSEQANEPVTYRQDGDLLWAEMPRSGSIRCGAVTGRCAPDGTLDFGYTMVLVSGEIVCGRCHSTPTLRDDGGIRLREEWERYGPNGAVGVSYLEEVDAPDQERAQ
jgi:hypothetical protein